MKQSARWSLPTLVAPLLGAASLSAQGTPTLSNPGPRPATTPPAVVTPPVLTPVHASSTAGFLHTGRYQLRLQAPSPITGAQATIVAEVNVQVTGTAVRITAGSAADAFDGTISGNQVQIHGVANGANVTLVGSPTPSGAVGTLTTQDSTRTVHGTFALTVIHETQLHKISEFGSKPATPPSKSWTDAIRNLWCGIGMC